MSRASSLIQIGALRFLAVIVLPAAVLTGCAANPPQAAPAGQETQSDSDADAPDADQQAVAGEPEARSDLPKQELTENILYEYLLAEIAGQRGNVGLAAQAYVDLAKRTRDPRIARRATEIALYARMNNAAIDSAKIWYETDADSQRPLQALSGLLIAGGRYDEAAPYLKKLLSTAPAGPAGGFVQLGRTLANAQDKKAALRLVQ